MLWLYELLPGHCFVMLFIIIFQFKVVFIQHQPSYTIIRVYKQILYADWSYADASKVRAFPLMFSPCCHSNVQFVCWFVCTILHLPSMHLRSCQGIVYTFISSFRDVCGMENVRYHGKRSAKRTSSFALIINDNFDTFFLTFAQLSQDFWTKYHKLFSLIKLVRKCARGQLVLWKSQRCAQVMVYELQTLPHIIISHLKFRLLSK